jgi:hypothetical protein
VLVEKGVKFPTFFPHINVGMLNVFFTASNRVFST